MGAQPSRMLDVIVQFVNASTIMKRPLALILLLAAASASCSEEATPGETTETPMARMISEIQMDARRTAPYTGVDRIGDAVVSALRATLREEFVPPRNRSLAYANHPLPIGHGQTISQPFIVAIMTEVLNVEPHDKVLEIGTGSGYQAAVLSHLAAEVYTIEIVPELAETATKRLDRLGYDNVHVRTGDGWYGWPDHAPFDGVIITAVSDEIPPALVEQLSEDGLLVMPLGDDDGFQELVVYSKRTAVTTPLFPVRFVPLTGEH